MVQVVVGGGGGSGGGGLCAVRQWGVSMPQTVGVGAGGGNGVSMSYRCICHISWICALPD